ncbi:hypothetical protein [Salinimonas chungwhensis]|uniref:hypothetical protein n=1 Tax=Salinimonas chungwhensis TaxID=265425 RepID=UPI00036E52C0|nr:hypothetical protein [Salinimonas chungwhensis]
MVSENVKAVNYHKPSVPKKFGLTIVGFLLFMTGAVLLAVGAIEVFKLIEDFATGFFLIGGLFLYKAGRIVLRHCATVRVKRERRNHLTL